MHRCLLITHEIGEGYMIRSKVVVVVVAIAIAIAILLTHRCSDRIVHTSHTSE